MRADVIGPRGGGAVERASVEPKAQPAGKGGFAEILQGKLQQQAAPAVKPQAAEVPEDVALEGAEPAGAEPAAKPAESSETRREATDETEEDAAPEEEGQRASDEAAPSAAAVCEHLGLGAGSANPGRTVVEGDSAAGSGAEAGPPRTPGGVALAEPEAPTVAVDDGPQVELDDEEPLELDSAGEGFELPDLDGAAPARVEQAPLHMEAPRNLAVEAAARILRPEGAEAPRATGWDADLVEQVQASQQLAQLKDGRMRLSIQEGGERVTVMIQERDGVMHLSARMGSRALAEAMNQRVFELREALAVHGVNLAEFSAHAEGHDTPQGGGGEQDGDEVAGSEAAPVGARAVPILRRQLVV